MKSQRKISGNMGAPQTQHRHGNYEAKQRLILAKKWEESIRDTLEIAWRQVEQSKRHLEIARVQVKEAESSLGTSSENNARDHKSEYSSVYSKSTQKEGGKKSLKGRALALVAKSLLNKGGGGTEGRDANTKVYADHDHDEDDEDDDDDDVSTKEGDEEKGGKEETPVDPPEALAQTAVGRQIQNSQHPQSRSVTVANAPESEDVITLGRKGGKSLVLREDKSQSNRLLSTGGKEDKRRMSVILEGEGRKSLVSIPDASRSNRDLRDGGKEDNRRSITRRKGNEEKSSIRRSHTKSSNNLVDQHAEKLVRKSEREEEDGEDRVVKPRQKVEREAHVKVVKKLERNHSERLSRKLDRDNTDRRLGKEDRRSKQGSDKEVKHGTHRKHSDSGNSRRENNGSKRRAANRHDSRERHPSRHKSRGKTRGSDENKRAPNRRSGEQRSGSRQLSRSLVESKRKDKRMDTDDAKNETQRTSAKRRSMDNNKHRLSQSLKESKTKDKKPDRDDAESGNLHTFSRSQSVGAGDPQLSRSLKEFKTKSDSNLIERTSSNNAGDGADAMQRLVNEARVQNEDAAASSLQSSLENLKNLGRLLPTKSALGDLSVSSAQLSAESDFCVVTSSNLRRDGTMDSHGISRSQSTKMISNSGDPDLEKRRDDGRKSGRKLLDESPKSSNEAATGLEDGLKSNGDKGIKRNTVDESYPLSTVDQALSRRSESKGRGQIKSDKAPSKKGRVKSRRSSLLKHKGKEPDGEAPERRDQDMAATHSMETEKRAGKGLGGRGDVILSQSTQSAENMIVFEEDLP